MKPIFSNTINHQAVQEPEVLNQIFHEIRSNKLGFPTKHLQQKIERSELKIYTLLN
jgi:hypothetical protein